MNISWWHWFKNKLFKIVHLVMAAELLACHGAHITEKLQAGWKAQQTRVSRLKIPKCFMQAWCIIVREFKCVFSEPKLLTGWLFCRDTEMWPGMEKLLDILYMRFVGFFDFGLVFFFFHGLQFIESASIFQMFKVSCLHVADHVWATERRQSCTSTGAVLFHLCVERTEVHWFWNYYSMGMLLTIIKMWFPSSPIHRSLSEKKKTIPE